MRWDGAGWARVGWGQTRKSQRGVGVGCGGMAWDGVGRCGVRRPVAVARLAVGGTRARSRGISRGGGAVVCLCGRAKKTNTCYPTSKKKHRPVSCVEIDFNGPCAPIEIPDDILSHKLLRV